MEEETIQKDVIDSGSLKESLLNAFSNILFLFCLWLMSLLLPKLTSEGFEAAGIFTMCLSVANIATAISTYNILSFYSSDTKKRFNDEHYFYFGIMTSLISLIVCVVICFIYGYQNTAEIFWSVVLYYCFKLFDNFSYILRASLQRAGKLTSFCYSLIARSLLSIGIFCLVLYFSQSLIITMGVLAVFGLLYFLCVDLMITKKYCKTIFLFNKDVFKKASSLFILALPVCIYGLSFAAIPSIPRLMYENIFHDATLLGYFGTMAAVTVLVQAAVTALMLPFIPKISNYYKNGQRKELIKLLTVIIGAVLALSAIAFVMIVFLGDWALKLVYGEEILKYSDVFKWIMLGTGLQSLVVVLSDTTTALRKLKMLTIASLSGVVAMASTMYVLISNFGMYGIVYVYFISYGVIALMLIITIVFAIYNTKKQLQINS